MRILYLEDSADDAELIRRLLVKQWPDCQVTVVSNRAGFLAELNRGGHDLILSDFKLPQFDGMQALELSRAHSSDIPFVFVSGHIPPDSAIEAVRAGAQDYVLKDRATRLLTVIPHALRERQERSRAHRLEAERHQLAATLENSPDFVGLSTPDGRMRYLNRAAREILGVPAGPLPPELRIETMHPPEIRQRSLPENLRQAIERGTWSGETVVLARSGRTVPVSQIIVAHRGPDGALEYLSTVMRDLSDHKRAEAMVNGQNQVLEMIAGSEPVNDTLGALLRFVEQQSEDIRCCILLVEEDGRALRPCVAPRLPEPYLAAIARLPIGPNQACSGTAAHERTAVVAADIATDPRWTAYRDAALAHGLCACWAAPIFDATHRLLGTLEMYLSRPGEPTQHHRHLGDVAVHIAAISLSRSAAERRLRDQAEILNKASDAIFVTDPTDRITFWNHGAERILGWSSSEALGRTEAELFTAAPLAELATASPAVDKEWRGEVSLCDRSGSNHVMEARVTALRDDSGKPQGRLVIATDLTARRRIEEQFFRAQRLESIGMLAAGIAHDLNNVLAPILLAAPMLRDHAADPADLRMIATLERSAERGAALVRQILGFAHGADGEHRILQAKHLLRDVCGFIEETFPKSITLHHRIAADIWPVKGNPTQLHQVLLNLSVNARDAMPDGGTLSLRGENVLLDETTAGEIEDGRPGAFVVLHVQDTGTGIDPDVLARIWEPFYTTKPSGKGTGLGLSTVRGIVESHSGFVSVHTIVGRGTTFRVYLPAAETSAGPAGERATMPPASRGIGELVLVVDDEPGIRNMAATILARNGYRVLTAADGAEAIAVFAPRSKEIRVVVTDLSMPNLDGAALAAVIRRINPAVRIIAVSGHSVDNAVGVAARQLTHAFLTKPFRPETLLTMIHELLRAPPNPPP